jgi:hypothetical protein
MNTMTPECLNRIGLALSMVGVVLLFVWGPPQPNLEEGIGLALEEDSELPNGEGTVRDHNRKVTRRRARHTVLSRIGLGLVGGGFLCQFAATWY